MTKRFILREEVTDCNVGDILEMKNGHEVLCTEKHQCNGFCAYRIGEKWYGREQLAEYFFTTKEVYPGCDLNGIYYSEEIKNA